MKSLIKKKIEKDGYYLFKNILDRKKINSLKNSMILVMKQFVKVKKLTNIDAQLDLYFQKSCKHGTILRSNIYKALSNLQELYLIFADKKINKIIYNLGIKSPRNQGTSLFAVEPFVDKFLTEIHQDIRNNFCSMKAINFWIPLSSGSPDSGGLGIYSGSHKLGPCKHVISKNSGLITVKNKKKLEKFKLVKINNYKIGDILVFSPFCSHFSLKNFSDRIRWTAAVCLDDAADSKHFKKKFNPYDRSNLVSLTTNEDLLRLKKKL